jgi:hypothetical protein
MHAMASQTRRDRRIWEQRQRAALGCYLTALFLGAVTIGPSVDHGDTAAVLFAIAIPATVLVIGRMIQPKNRRPL